MWPPFRVVGIAYICYTMPGQLSSPKTESSNQPARRPLMLGYDWCFDRRGARAIGLAARPPARFISLPSPKSTKNHPHDSELTVFALGSGAAVFLLTTLLIYAVLTIVCGAFIHSVPWLGLVALEIGRASL